MFWTVFNTKNHVLELIFSSPSKSKSPGKRCCSPYLISPTSVRVAVWRSGNTLVSINEVNLCWARLVLGWVTVSGFDSRRRHFISVCNESPRSTQPSTLRGTVNEYQPDDWMKRRRNVLPEKPVPEALLHSAPNTHVRPAGKTVVLGSDSSATSALIAQSALPTD